MGYHTSRRWPRRSPATIARLPMAESQAPGSHVREKSSKLSFSAPKLHGLRGPGGLRRAGRTPPLPRDPSPRDCPLDPVASRFRRLPHDLHPPFEARSPALRLSRCCAGCRGRPLMSPHVIGGRIGLRVPSYYTSTLCRRRDLFTIRSGVPRAAAHLCRPRRITGWPSEDIKDRAALLNPRRWFTPYCPGRR
jgi:hypothetical protein